MRSNVPSTFQSRFRKVAARARVINERPVFQQYPQADASYLNFTQFSQYAANGRLYRYGLQDYETSGEPYTIYENIPLLTTEGGALYSGYVPLPLNFPSSAAPISENHRTLAAYLDNEVGYGLYAALNGVVYKHTYSPINGNGWTQVYSFVDMVTNTYPQISLVGLGPNLLVAAIVYSGPEIDDHCYLAVIENGVVDTWEGYLPKHTTRPGLAAVQTADGTIHIYVEDWSGKKPLYIRRFAAKIWSATQEILPMDALDIESEFKIGWASLFSNGRVYLTGRIKRQYGPAYSVYLLGPDKFTFGRDMIISSNIDRPMMLAEGDGYIWAVNDQDVFNTPLVPGIFSDTAPTAQIDIARLNLEMGPNTADRLSLDVPASELEAHPLDLAPGAMLDLDVIANDVPYTIGRFGIDRLREIVSSDGKSFTVDCTSYAMKKLLDWTSDTYFDYMGQGEAHGDPGDLTKLVRFSGGKYTSPADGGLQIESLNDDGMLYTTVPAAHGGFIKCQFTNLQAADNLVGVGLNYGEESLAEAAARLGKKPEEVQAGERGRWVLMAVLIPDLYGGDTRSKIVLVDYNTLRKGSVESPDTVYPYRVIASAYINKLGGGLPVLSTVVMAMQYQDGYARVYFAPSDTPDLRLVISAETTLSWEFHPTEHENYGRGLIFMRNNTGFHMSYPVMSDSDVIPLYMLGDKALKYTYPLEDRTDKFKSTGGTVQIDSEQVVYTGIAGYDDNRGVIQDLQYQPGKVIARAGDGITTPAGTDTDFAKSRGTGTGGSHLHGNNYVMQCFTPTNGQIMTAIRVWLKKVNYPEDGVTITINQGNVSNSAASVALLSNVVANCGSVSASQLPAEGGWITFFLDKDLTVSNISGQQYWIIIRRNKNANHPSSTSYFQYKKMGDNTYTGGGCYVFCEEDDQSVGQSGDMAFVVYARMDGQNKEFIFPLEYRAGVGYNGYTASQFWDANGNPTAYQNYYNGMAITITQGAGKNNCYRVVRSFRLTDSLNDLYCFALDRDPGKIFGTDTKGRVVPAIYGLKRGQNSTTASAHGDKSMVSVAKNSYPLARYFEYYTADEDLTLAEIAESIARKAGVLAVDLCNRHPGQILPGDPNSIYLPMVKNNKNVIVNLEIPASSGANDIVAVSWAADYDGEDREVMQVRFTNGSFAISTLDWTFDENTATWQSTSNNVLSLPLDEVIRGNFRVSLYDGHISVWCGGRLIGAANLGANLKQWDKFKVTASYASPLPTKVLVPQAGTRVDSFVMDMGKTGAQLLQSLIGEARVYYRDDGTGRLKIYTDRETLADPYTRAMAVSKETTDIGLATRVLLEGGEVVEVSSAGNLQQYGNFFRTFNFNQINNLDDAAYFADLVLEDMSLNRERVEIEGAADPRIEPTDIITITFPDNTQRSAVVDGVSQQMSVDETEASYDMRLTGRFIGG